MKTASEIQDILQGLSCDKEVMTESFPTKSQQNNLMELLQSSRAWFELADEIYARTRKAFGGISRTAHYMDVVNFAEEMTKKMSDIDSYTEKLKGDIQRLLDES